MKTSHEEAVSYLGLGRVEKRLSSPQPNAVSLIVKDDAGSRCLVKFRSGTELDLTPHQSAWTLDTQTRRTRRGDVTAEDEFDPLQVLLEEFSRQDEAARKGGGQFVVPLEIIGHYEDAAYSKRKWFEFSLQQLIEGKSRPRSSEELFHMVHNVWTALCFLHQPRVNVPHGNLKPANVLIEMDGGQPGHLLTDMQMRMETDYITAKREDMQCLGLLIAQYCECRSDLSDWQEADRHVSRSKWDFLGSHELGWKKLCRQLLTPEHYDKDYDAEADRHIQLRPLRPDGFKLAVVPPPAHVAETVRSSLMTSRLNQVRRQIESTHWQAAIDELCRLEEQCQEGENAPQRPAVMSMLNLAADIVPPVDSDPHALGSLQRAAQRGSGRACCRLGEHFRHSDAAMAKRMFLRAGESNDSMGFVLLGEMCMSGAPGLEPDEEAAAQYFHDAIRVSDTPEAKFHLARLILRGRTLTRLEKAVEYLEEAAEAHVHGAAGLLGLCYATGLGVPADGDRAFKLFQKAWQDSEEAGAPDYTALNNLAVCIANGIGVPGADVQRAIRYMEKAAESGCRGAQYNLSKMPRKIYL